MTFQPVLVGSGLVGWRFLQATLQNQRQAFDNGALELRDTAYFENKIATIDNAESLVTDRRLLRVALTAFGLQDDINNKFFIRKVLEEGVTDRDALANKLTDDRYKALARTFAFDSASGPSTKRAGFAEEIIARYRAQQFELAVGEQDETLRLAMNFERALPEVAAGAGSNDTKWFRVMGTPPLRTVFETALGLPSGFGQLDIDRQVETLREKAGARFGASEIIDLSSEEIMSKIVRSYLLQSQLQQSSASQPGQTALALISAIPRQSLFNKI
nr:DUF1217 domain-containing protein [Thalassococcus arenae]